MHKYYPNAPPLYVARTLPSYLHSIYKLWPRKLFCIYQLEALPKLFLFLSPDRVTLNQEDHTVVNTFNLFSTQLYPPNVANIPNCCKITLTVIVVVQSDVRNNRRHFRTECLQRISMLEQLRPIVLLLRHGYYLVKNIESRRELVNFMSEKWKSGSFI